VRGERNRSPHPGTQRSGGVDRVDRRGVVLRAEQTGDAPGIRAVHEAALPGPSEARLVDALRAAGRLEISLVAEAGTAAIVGHIAFSRVELAGTAGGIGLAPLAVVPASQRQGIGARLVRDGLRACRQAGSAFAVVLGDPAYYRRFGFAPARRWGLFDAYGGDAAFQAVELRAGTIPRGAGLVRYAPEFGIVSTPPPG
jgi:putative acetyltransferase